MAKAKKTVRSPYDLSRLTFGEVEKEIARLPALIVPLGGCEPYGEGGTLGAASACAETLAAALSAKLHMLLAPTLAYGCSTPYGAFGGNAGVKQRTLINILGETVRQWYGQGFRTVIIVDGVFDNGDAVDAALRRLNDSNARLKAISFSLQRDERIRAFIGHHLQEKEFGRTEYGILSLAAFIDPDLARPSDKKNRSAAPMDAERFRTWRKRGADPGQFRKLFPNAASTGACKYDADFGKELFDFILQLLVDTASPLLKFQHQ
jgi:creatinine amidohydrolase/Fe(II)-dependent formamide hydrolase-like protein